MRSSINHISDLWELHLGIISLMRLYYNDYDEAGKEKLFQYSERLIFDLLMATLLASIFISIKVQNITRIHVSAGGALN